MAADDSQLVSVSGPDIVEPQSAGEFAGFALNTASHPSGAVFKLSEASSVTLNVVLDDQTTVCLLVDLPYLFVGLGAPKEGHQAAKDLSLQVAQRTLDVLSVMGHGDLCLHAVRGDEDHLVWWRSEQNGSVLRWTAIENLPDELFRAFGERMAEQVRSVLPAGIQIAPPPPTPDWHPSFRYFRLAQTSQDLVEAFRNAFLAVESVLDHVHPAGPSGTGETRWIQTALARALDGVNLEGVFRERREGQSIADHIVSDFYRLHRGSLFHSKLSYGAARVRLPHLEHERTVQDLEKALSELKFLYIKLASTHLGLDRRAGSVLLEGGWDLITGPLLGKLTLHLTDDDAPASARVGEIQLNPRNRWMMPIKTRHARAMERKLTRVFLGVVPVRDIPSGMTIRGVVAACDGEPMFFGDFGGYVLDASTFDRLEVAFGMTALNQGSIRQSFKT